MALPPSAIHYADGDAQSEAFLQVGIVTKPVMFKAFGLGVALAATSFSVSQTAVYQ